MNKFQFQISVRPLTLTLLSLMLFISTTENAYGELTYRDKDNKIVSQGKDPNKFPVVTCGQGEATNKELKGSVTDKAGNMFSLFCINKSYFEGIVKTIDAPLSNPLGRCVFDGGLNVFNFEVNEKNVFTQIEWINVAPKKGLENKKIYAGIENGQGAVTDKWLPNARKFITDNKLKGRVYTQDFLSPPTGSVQIASALDQGISSYENGELISLDVLTPEEANIAYEPDGKSSISALVIDPLMGTPGSMGPQDSTSVPEPSSTFSFLALGTLGAVSIFKRKLKPSQSSEKETTKVG